MITARGVSERNCLETSIAISVSRAFTFISKATSTSVPRVLTTGLQEGGLAETRSKNLAGLTYTATSPTVPLNAIDVLGLYPLTLTLTTVIRPPAAEAGTKTSQTVVVETKTGQTNTPSPYVGATTVLGHNFEGSGQFTSTIATPSSNMISITVTGAAQSYFLPSILAIVYDVKLNLDLSTGEASVSGGTNGFPSYEVYIDGTEIFDRQQGSFWQLLGAGDIPFDIGLRLDANGNVVPQRRCP